MADHDLNIPLVIKELRRETANCYSIVYVKPTGFTFEPGMWLDLRFPEAELAIGRSFSFASAPSEPDLMITFKSGVSPFKRRMAAVQPGEVMLITQYGSNGFHRDQRRPAVFMAGGVGIAPLRSMIKKGIDYKEELDATLIYSNRDDEFPFREELEEWRRSDPTFSAHYLATSRAGRLTREKLSHYLSQRDLSAAMYYVAGPPAMVDSAKSMLASLQIGAKRILTDSFTGYD